MSERGPLRPHRTGGLTDPLPRPLRRGLRALVGIAVAFVVLTVFLALYAFAVFGYVTATLARFLIGRDMEQGSAVRISDSEVAALIGELSRLRATVEEGKRSPASKP